MARRRVSKNAFSCGHKGFGASCHRCETAEALECAASSKAPYVTNKKRKDPKEHKTWSSKELLKEANRLREEARHF